DHLWALAERTGTFYGIKMKARHIYAVAGGGGSFGNGIPATRAYLGIVTDEHYSGLLEAGLRIDHQGNLVVTDLDRGLIRVVAGLTGTFYGQRMRAGHIYTIAGSGRRFTDGGLGTRSSLLVPTGIAIDHRGNVIIAEDDLVTALAESSGRFYGRTMV